MNETNIRLLRADEIECRTGIIRESGLSLLLYKDARVDQNILDEVFGIFGWKREHQIMDGKMFCTISVKDEDGNWITKQDVGTESYSEPTKGAASDSFKRAAFNVGIGRELYTAPFIWIPASAVRLEKKGDRLITKDSFYVSMIQYEDKIRAISALRICNQNHLTVYEIGSFTEERAPDQPMENQQKPDKKNTKKTNTTASNGKRRKKSNAITTEQIMALKMELQRTRVGEFQVLQRYGVPALEAMDEETYQRAMIGLQKTPTAA